MTAARQAATSTELIDLRSDTVTRPSPEMREALASAEVGDDQFGEDPTMNRLQERIAVILGKEAALWLPSGTMANQVALRTLTSPGDDAIVSRESHMELHETGGAAANAGVQLTAIGARGVFSLDEFLAARKPRGHIIYPPTTLVAIENTHNRAGGVVFPLEEASRIGEMARDYEISSYLDGARVWNAAVALGQEPAALAAPFDLVGVALSKGLGAPGGSLLAGSRDLIDRAARHRRMFGGAMRQVGIFAAAGLYGLERNIARLTEDHANARLIAETLAQSSRIELALDTVQTNIVMFTLTNEAPNAAAVIDEAGEQGVLAFAFGPRTIRLVTHLDVSREQCERAAEVFVELAERSA